MVDESGELFPNLNKKDMRSSKDITQESMKDSVDEGKRIDGIKSVPLPPIDECDEALFKDKQAVASIVGSDVAITQVFADRLAQLKLESEDLPIIRDNFRIHASLLKKGRYTLTDYLNAVVYVSIKIGYKTTQMEAYKRTFPEKVQRLVDQGKDYAQIHNHATRYASNKLVQMVEEKAAIPVYLLYADHYADAIKVQAELMNGAKSEMVRQRAADSIMSHLAKPVEQHSTLSVDLNADSETTKMFSSLAQTMDELSSLQLGLIKDKHSSLDVLNLADSSEEIDYIEIDDNGE